MFDGISHFCFSHIDSDSRFALARSLSRHAFFHSWGWWQSYDVRQPDLGLGSP